MGLATIKETPLTDPRLHTRSFRQAAAAVVMVAVAAGLLAHAAPATGQPVVNVIVMMVDGNMAVDAGQEVDWQSFVPGGDDRPLLAHVFRHALVVDATGAGDDRTTADADEPCPQPSTAEGDTDRPDLQRLHVAAAQHDGELWMGLAWLLASASDGPVALELNQSTELCDNGVTAKRTDNDLLVQVSESQGTTTVTVQEWVERRLLACEDALKLLPPCWGKRHTLSPDQVTTATNHSDIQDPFTGQTLGPGRFSEAGINLSASGLIPPVDRQCRIFQTAVGSGLEIGLGGDVPTPSDGANDVILAGEAEADVAGPLDIGIGTCAKIAVTTVDDNGDLASDVELAFFEDDGDGELDLGTAAFPQIGDSIDQQIDACTTDRGTASCTGEAPGPATTRIDDCLIWTVQGPLVHEESAEGIDVLRAEVRPGMHIDGTLIVI